MTLHLDTLAAILAMAVVTYTTRLTGVAVLRRYRLGPRLASVLEAVPGCVLVAVIAPAALGRGPGEAAAAAVTLLAALRLPLAAVVLVGVGAAAGFRALLG